MVNSASQLAPKAGAVGLIHALKRLEGVLGELRRGELTVADTELDALSLVLAALYKLNQPGEKVLQVAVLGPTQAGKSTLVNALCAREVTSVSALAGHTRHARGAAFAVTPAWVDWLDEALQPAHRVAGEALDAARLDQYSLVEFAQPLPESLPNQPAAIIWDTPDFDSLTAQSYRRAVLRVAGLADLIILIASRDKYGDMAVWQTLASLRPLKRRGLLVINKVAEGQWQELSAHITSTQDKRFGEQAYALAHIPQVAVGAAVDANDLLRAMGEINAVETSQLVDGINELCEQHWAAWTAPLVAECDCVQEWQNRLEHSREAFLLAYRRDYLADVDRYDTFARLVARLLVMLEIPLIARTMGSVRRVVTWPVRKVLQQRSAQPDLGREPELLSDGAQHVLLDIRTALLEPDTNHPVWARLSQGLAGANEAIADQFLQAATRHHAAFQTNVDAAAELLFERLQDQPLVLNGLRAVRASADAAGVVVALQTGGIGLSDLVLTPVMLSLTSTLTESAARGYVDQVMDELKEQQFSAVADLFDQAIGQPLQAQFDAASAAEFSGLELAELTSARDRFVGVVDA